MIVPKSPSIGIIAGSGPEAGLDLCTKILAANRHLKREAFAGDLDAPEILMWSRPELGHSMDMETNSELVWPFLLKAATLMGSHTNRFTIACNTLHYFEPRLRELNLCGNFVSVRETVADFCESAGIGSFALLGANPVAQFGRWSPYAGLESRFEIELSPEQPAVHQLIHDVKRLGAHHTDVKARFEAILESLKSKTVVLACTELPLIHCRTDLPKHIVDVTALLATRLLVPLNPA